MLQTDWKVAENLARIQQRIAEVALRVGRGAEEITVVAVSKTQPVDAVATAIGAGLVHFGENRVQEAANKIPSIKRRPDAQATLFHMLGHLQRNKVGSAVGLFDYVDSLDSLHLAQALGRRVVSEGRDDLAARLEVYVGD
ncbi:MAG: YggS family pyridoxal phosphate-dependent enzyme, partial [Chloroflexota bacterium]